MKLRILFALVLCLCLCVQKTLSQEDDVAKIEKENEVDLDAKVSKTKFYVLGDFITVASPANGEALTGLGVTFQVQFGLNNDFALNASVRQSFAFGGSGIITSFDGRLTYALTGKLIGVDKVAGLNGSKIVRVKDHDLSGFRLQLIASQYYFNASTTTVPYSGMGASGYYEFTGSNRFNYIVGGRMDMIANSEYSTSPLSFFVGLGISI